MHEQSLMNNLMKKILLLAKEQKATKVTRVTIKLGALSHMSPSHFQEHFTIAARGTLAQNARIDAEVGHDVNDPQALDIVLKSIDIA